MWHSHSRHCASRHCCAALLSRFVAAVVVFSGVVGARQSSSSTQSAAWPVCAVGMSVAARWGGNGAYYAATIERLDPTTKQVTVAWSDGDQTHRIVQPDQVHGCRVDFSQQARSTPSDRGHGGAADHAADLAVLPVCAPGMTVKARFRGDLKMYEAKIESIHLPTSGGGSGTSNSNGGSTVSYTHLTLPTIYSV